MKRKLLLFGLVTFAIVIVLAPFLYLGYEAAEIIRPPSGEVNLTQFLSSGRQTCCVQDIVIEDKTNTIVIGVMSIPTVIGMRPGPPAYIFDERQVLVDWCGDIGDNPGFIKKWGNFTHVK